MLRSQLLNRRMTSNKIDKRINAIVARLFTQLEALIQSVREFNERVYIFSTEGNVMFEQSRSTGQRLDNRSSLAAPDSL